MPLIEQEPKKNIKAPKGPVVRQFQWFQMQTRVRKIITEIVNPIQFQIIKNTSNIQKLQKNDETFHERIQYILKMTTNDPQVFQKGVFKKIEDKFQSQQKILTFLEEQVKNNTVFINNKINLIDQRMKQSNDMITQIQQLKKSNRQNLKLQTQKFDTVRKNIEVNVQKMSIAIEENQKLSRQKVQRLQKQIASNVMKMEHIAKEFCQVSQLFRAQKTINDDFIAQGIKTKQQNRQFDTKLSDMNKKIKDLNKIKPFLKDVQIDFKKLLFKVDSIVPLINEAQINQCLYKILPQKFHPRIAVYQFQKYIELNNKVLSRHFQSDSASIDFNGQQLIRQSQQRNTRLLTKLKLSYYKNNGIDLDFISFEQRQRLLNDFQYAKLCEIVDELQEMENQKNDRKKQHKLNEEDIIKIVNKQFNNDRDILVDKIHSEMIDSKSYLQNQSQQMHKLFESLETQIQKITKNLQNHVNISELSLKQLQQNYPSLHQNINQNGQKIDAIYCFNKEVSNYLQKVLTANKKIKSNEQSVQKQNSNHILNVRRYPNPEKNTEQNKKIAPVGVMMMNDLSDISDSNRLNQSSVDLKRQEPFQAHSDQEQILLKMKNALEKYKQVQSQVPKSTQKHFRSSFSKFTRPSESQLRLKSQASYQIPKCRKQLQLCEINKSKDIQLSAQKSYTKSFMNIPSFNDERGTKYCREAYTSRLNMRIKPSFSCSKDVQSFQKIKNSQVRNSLACFSGLKKQNIRYLQ